MVKGEPLRYLKGHNTGVGSIPIVERLQAYIAVSPTGCWLWQGATRARYGAITIDGRVKRAHRVSYEAYVGEIPEGMLVLHTCDTPLCINPLHLFLGTGQDNSDDKVAKGRQARGSRGGKAVLTEEEVLALRQYEHTHSYQDTADRFGVSKGTVADIINGRTWVHI